MAVSIVSNVESKEHWQGGTLSDIVLIDEATGVCVQGRGITYLESHDDTDYLQEVYDEWLDSAKLGEEGFSIV
jgi:hypothetical protein